MIFFDRAAMQDFRPKSLNDRKFIGPIQKAIRDHMLLPPEKRAQTDIPPVWKTPFQDDVLSALGAGSDGCCAFCGLRAPLSVYRFRPPAYAQPDKPVEGKESYLWLTFEWENLFPICADCRPSNQNYFPVIGNRAGYQSEGWKDERAVLLYPGASARPYQHFSARTDGVLLGRSDRGRATIDHFHLNAPAKVAQRKDLFDTTLHKMQRPGWEWDGLAFGTGNGAWYLLLRRIAREVLKQGRKRGSRAPKALHRTMARLARDDSYPQWLEAAIAAVRTEDAESSDFAARVASAAEPVAARQPLPAPRLSRVDLTTYKSLERITFDIAADLSDTTKARLYANAATTSNIPQTPCVLILGENATGKSSILEAIALTLIDEGQRTALELNTANLTLDPEYMGDPRATKLASSDITITFHSEEDAPPRYVTLRINGAAGSFREGGDRTAPLPPVFAYGAHRLYGQDTRHSDLRHIETLFHNDRQLPKPETWLATLSPQNLDEVARALRHIIQIDGDFQTIEIDPESGQCKINIQKTTPDGTSYIVPQRMDIVSSGYRAVFALICDVLEGLTARANGDVGAARRTPAIVLIDEIEAHLHPRWKLHVVTGLRRALPHVTFIITSHDPLCVRGMYNGEVLALNRYQNTARAGLGMPERVEPVEGFENVETLTIEQLLTSELFQLLSTDNPDMDRAMAQAADTLSQADADTPAPVTDEIRRIITDALPYGQSELARVVQEAVSEYLVERRERDHDTNAAARERAKEEIKKRLRALMP